MMPYGPERVNTERNRIKGKTTSRLRDEARVAVLSPPNTFKGHPIYSMSM